MPDVFQETQREREEDARSSGLELAVVTNVRDNANHQVKVRVLSPQAVADEDSVATVLVGQQGNINLPQAGDIVVLALNVSERPIILGTLYGRGGQIPEYVSDERQISHEATGSVVHFKNNGNLLIENDNGNKVEVEADTGVIRVNGGSNPVVTDVSGSGVDSVSKSNDLQVP